MGVSTLLNTGLFFSVSLFPAPSFHRAPLPSQPSSPGVSGAFLLFSDTITLPPLSFSSAQTLLLPPSSPSFHFWMLLMSAVSPPSGSLAPPPLGPSLLSPIFPDPP